MTVLAGAFPTIVSLSNWIAYRMVPSRRVFGVQRRAVGRVSLIGAGPGAADLITLRGMRRLQEADVVYFDRLADPALPDLARPGARRVNVGKAPGHHPVPQERINQLLVESALAGQNVVRLKCGDPGIFGRGAEEACACAAAGIEVEIIPGVTAASGAAAAAGGFLTERGCTDRVILVTGHVRSGPRTDWTGMSMPGTTLVIYMGLAGLGRTAEGLMDAGWPGAALVEIVCNAQAANQSVLNTTLACLPDLRAPGVADGPATVLIRWPSGMAESAGCDGRARPAFVPPNEEISDVTASFCPSSRSLVGRGLSPICGHIIGASPTCPDSQKHNPHQGARGGPTGSSALSLDRSRASTCATRGFPYQSLVQPAQPPLTIPLPGPPSPDFERMSEAPGRPIHSSVP